MTWSNLLDTIEVDWRDACMDISLDLCTSVDHLALGHRPSSQADQVHVFFFQNGHEAWSCPPVDHALISFFLADHAQEYSHIGKAHRRDMAFYMIDCLDHCIQDNHMPMAMSTLFYSSKQRKDISNAISHDVFPPLCAAVSHGHAEICSIAFET